MRKILVTTTSVFMMAAVVAGAYSARVASAQSAEEKDAPGIAVLENANPSEARNHNLEGTWRVTVTPGPGGPPPSNSYHTYFADGGLIQSNLTEGGIPGHGAWERGGRNEFTLVFEKFVPFNPVLNQQGVFVFKVTETIQLRGDTYTGVGQGHFCNAQGAECISVGFAQTSGRRMR